MRILVIRRDNIGDLVCTTPLFAALRARYPQAHIAALVNSYNAAVLEGNPHVDAVHSYTKLKHRLPGESRLGILLARLRMLARLRHEPFDYIVLAKAGFDRHGLRLARQLRRRHIVGFAEPGAQAPRSITVPVPALAYGDLHEVEVMKRLAEAVDVRDAGGPLRVYPARARLELWRARLPALAQRGGRRWIAAHISARELGRHWPMERWAELIRRVTATGQTGVVLLWAPGPENDPRHPGDDAKAAAILQQVGASVLPAPTAELADLIAAIALCDAFIGADGGAMHLAAALGLPTLALFENREDKKRRWYPWQVPYELVAPATRDIADITVEQVVQGWQRLAPRVASREAAAAI
ncbi:MAG TPA: glycosyltransferase family 9 protein [Burkholderiales bacterium]|nr:glycosyltransferase family 9 protein [Burkholderiales bacterium]